MAKRVILITAGVLVSVAAILGFVHWRYGLRRFFGGFSWRSEWCAKCGLWRTTRHRYVGPIRWWTTVQDRRETPYRLLTRLHPECSRHSWVYYDGAICRYDGTESGFGGYPSWMLACDQFMDLADRDLDLCREVLKAVIDSRVQGDQRTEWDVLQVIDGVEATGNVEWFRIWWKAYQAGKPMEWWEAYEAAGSAGGETGLPPIPSDSRSLESPVD